MKSLHPSVFKIPLWISLLVTNILFFIDEGYNDFRWMKDPGNWVVFVIYVVGIYAVLFTIAVLITLGIRMTKQLVSRG
jgi:hypothetical protein